MTSGAAPQAPLGAGGNLAALIEAMTDEQARRCAYGTREGDGQTCDCKFAFPRLDVRSSEQTGCAELRTAIRRLQADLPRVDEPRRAHGVTRPTDARTKATAGDVGPCWYCKRMGCDGCPLCCPVLAGQQERESDA